MDTNPKYSYEIDFLPVGDGKKEWGCNSHEMVAW